jgi:hypothetical protein
LRADWSAAFCRQLHVRLQVRLLSAAGNGLGLIIPGILRGGDDVPPRIREHVHCVDFSKFTLATPRLASNPE